MSSTNSIFDSFLSIWKLRYASSTKFSEFISIKRTYCTSVASKVLKLNRVNCFVVIEKGENPLVPDPEHMVDEE